MEPGGTTCGACWSARLLSFVWGRSYPPDRQQRLLHLGFLKRDGRPISVSGNIGFAVAVTLVNPGDIVMF